MLFQWHGNAAIMAFSSIACAKVKGDYTRVGDTCGVHVVTVGRAVLQKGSKRRIRNCYLHRGWSLPIWIYKPCMNGGNGEWKMENGGIAQTKLHLAGHLLSTTALPRCLMGSNSSPRAGIPHPLHMLRGQTPPAPHHLIAPQIPSRWHLL